MKALILAAILAQAQGQAPSPDLSPVTRADVHFVLGWQNVQRRQPVSQYNNWINDILNGGAGAGWYWNDHLKTQVDFGANTLARQYRYEPFTSGSIQSYQASQLSTRKQSVAIGQQYQFFRNQWFHPHVGAGVDLARETTTEEYQPVLVFDNVGRTSRELPGHTDPPQHRFVARPFLEAGFKAYMSRRAFFLTDSRFAFKGGVNEVLFRFGFGVDF